MAFVTPVASLSRTIEGPIVQEQPVPYDFPGSFPDAALLTPLTNLDSHLDADVTSSIGTLVIDGKAFAMDWLIWVIVIILIVAVVWWLLNRNSGASSMASDRVEVSEPPAESVKAQSPAQVPATPAPASQAPSSAPSSPAQARETEASGSSAYPAPSEPTATSASSASMATEPAPTSDPGYREADWAEAPAPDGGDVDDWDADVEPTRTHSASAARLEKDKAEDADKAEWEAQWSEGSTSAPGQSTEAPHEHHHDEHHHEYTGAHAPTLPGAESAAAESPEAETVAAQKEAASGEAGASEASAPQPPAPDTAFDPDQETLQRAESSAVTESSLSHTAEPGSHLAAEQPYGEGSAAAGADGSGPDGYTVKGDAESMTYFEESNPAYEEATASVWFESVAHAEAAGFRPPRRTRL